MEINPEFSWFECPKCGQKFQVLVQEDNGDEVVTVFDSDTSRRLANAHLQEEH